MLGLANAVMAFSAQPGCCEPEALPPQLLHRLLPERFVVLRARVDHLPPAAIPIAVCLRHPAWGWPRSKQPTAALHVQGAVVPAAATGGGGACSFLEAFHHRPFVAMFFFCLMQVRKLP